MTLATELDTRTHFIKIVAEVIFQCDNMWEYQNWLLDVAFDEDSNKTRKENSPQNLSLLRKFTLNILRNIETEKQ
ncbi:MAG: hypothetical protein ABF633_19115 [Clostridium sp.]|uniref:hypothetical protein n=1 Tax=Clostridium sp. TaxID=1506 RepID=UPI0039E7348F